MADAGPTADGGVTDAGPASTAGTCGVAVVQPECTVTDLMCSPGNPCNPNSSTNQGYDPCYFVAISGQLGYRSPVMLCQNGYCNNPPQGDPCTQICLQTPDDPRATTCENYYDGSQLCLPACTTDTDCTGATAFDQQSYNPPLLTNYCVNNGGGSACQPLLCYNENNLVMQDASVLYKPCTGYPDTLCEPQFSGDDSAVIGYCTAVRPGATATVGQACDETAGREATTALCGADAICLGGRCAAICDASQNGGKGTPACPTSLTCISAQNVALTADYQVGGCSTPCDPFADAAHDECMNYCGGPPAKCHWIVGDPNPGEPSGYCGAALTNPVAVGQPCTPATVDQCVAGAQCLLQSDGVTTLCTELCNVTAAAGSPDSCRNGVACTVIGNFTKAGACGTL